MRENFSWSSCPHLVHHLLHRHIFLSFFIFTIFIDSYSKRFEVKVFWWYYLVLDYYGPRHILTFMFTGLLHTYLNTSLPLCTHYHSDFRSFFVSACHKTPYNKSARKTHDAHIFHLHVPVHWKHGMYETKITDDEILKSFWNRKVHRIITRSWNTLKRRGFRYKK